MSVSVVTPGLLHCDGTARCACPRVYDAGTLSSAREARTEARRAGWRTNLPGGRKRRRLDECPSCRQRSTR